MKYDYSKWCGQGFWYGAEYPWHEWAGENGFENFTEKCAAFKPFDTGRAEDKRRIFSTIGEHKWAGKDRTGESLSRVPAKSRAYRAAWKTFGNKHFDKRLINSNQHEFMPASFLQMQAFFIRHVQKSKIALFSKILDWFLKCMSEKSDLNLHLITA